MELECPLQSAASEHPDLPAIDSPDRTITFRELDRLVASAAAGFRGEGVRAGDRIAFLMDADWRYVVLLLAAIRAGAVACPMSTRLPASTVERLRAGIHAHLLVTRYVEFDSDPRENDGVISEDRPATIVFTSGSTGSARAAMHTFGNHYFSAAGSNANIRLQPGDRWLLSLPLYHVGGLGIVFRCLLGRATIVLPGPGIPTHEAAATATHISMVATQLKRLLDAARMPPLKAALLGGSAIPHSLVDEAYRRGIPIHTSYGLTEMTSQVTTTPPGSGPHALHTSGRVLPHREIRIDAGGQIHVRGRTRFAGYVVGDELERPFDEDGWFATGDVGEKDSGGWLRVAGRLDNMFISGGENVIPEAIEMILSASGGVRRAVVVPVEDDEFGQRPVAFVDVTSGAPDEDRLRQAVEAQLPRFMIPIRFYPWPAGDAEGMKIDRASFRRQAMLLMEARRE